jgi:hypothetical protein
VAEKLHAEPHPGLIQSINSRQDAGFDKESASVMQDGKERAMFRSGTGSDAAASLKGKTCSRSERARSF